MRLSLILVVLILILPFSTTAFVIPNPLEIFGGKVLSSIPCTCNLQSGAPFGFWLTVGPPRPGQFLYIPGVSTIYRFYSPFSGRWVLGNVKRTRQPCWQGPYPPYCVNLGTYNIINKIGTSLY